LELEVWSFSGVWMLVLGVLTQTLPSGQTPFDFHGTTENSEDPKVSCSAIPAV
jgi:hypothetical protein